MTSDLKEIELVVQTGPKLSNRLYRYSAIELSCPDADHKDSLFDWQMENSGAETIDKFGGVEFIAESLGTDLMKGLTEEQVKDEKREEIYGNNRHEKHKPVTYCELICEGLHDLIMQIFIVACIVSIIAGIATEGWETGWIEGFAIFVAVVVIINVEAINDLQKDKQFAELSEINANKDVKVLRNGVECTISTDDLVVGDIMILVGGDTVPADGILISGVNIKVDESKLTGESKQLTKNKEKNPFLVSSSDVHDGYMRCLVTAVGMNSVFGKLKSLVEGGNNETTPLQSKLIRLTKQLTVLGAVIASLVTIILLLTHFIEYGIGNGTVDENGDPHWAKSNWNTLMEYILTGIALLVIVIPEGLPLAVTIALAYSVKRMMKDNNLVRHLDACETMGGANTICSDKTGTLTKGQMTVVQTWVLDDKDGKFLSKRNIQHHHHHHNHNDENEEVKKEEEEETGKKEENGEKETVNDNNKSSTTPQTNTTTTTAGTTATTGTDKKEEVKPNEKPSKDVLDNEYTEFINKCKKIPKNLMELFTENCCLNNDGFLTNKNPDDDNNNSKSNNNNNNKTEQGIGSSVDVAMLFWMKELGIDYKKCRELIPKTTEEIDNKQSVIATIPFHSDRKRSSCVVKYNNNHYRVYVKGAPEMLVRLSDQMKSEVEGEYKALTGNVYEDENGKLIGEGSRKRIVQSVVNKMASTGLRIIGLGYRDFDHSVDWNELIEYKTEEQKGVGKCPVIEDHLTLIGFVGLEDPVRPEVPDCVLKCQDAGIFVRMVTGDAMDTAKSIAKQCHIYHEQLRIDKYNKCYPPGLCMSGSQFRELVGGLVLPPHFYHECHCQNYATDPHFKVDYVSPIGFPSIVGHISENCKNWTTDAIAKRNSSCTDECKKYGCFKQLPKSSNSSNNDEKELQKYKVVKNQAAFDPLVDRLQVLARSAPTDKHLLVTGLMERGQVVAVTGDGTNDGPALAKSNVGFAMGISGTSVAQEASDIILMDDNFASIVAAVKWGRNIYDSTRKFLQFQLAVSGVATVIGFVSGLILRETPLKPIQMQWVHLIMDTLAAVALATEYPTPDQLDRPPYNKNDSIMNATMFRNILSYFFYQVSILMFLIFDGHNIFGEPIGIRIGFGAAPTVHITMVFNTFAMLQIFNQICARKLNNEWNYLENVSSGYSFIGILLIEFFIQILIVSVGSTVFSVVRLSFVQHLYCMLMAICCIINGEVCRFVPPKLFKIDLPTNYKIYGEGLANALTSSRRSQYSLPDVSSASPRYSSRSRSKSIRNSISRRGSFSERRRSIVSQIFK